MSKVKTNNLELIIGYELLDLDIVNNDPWALANSVEIRISNNKDLLASFIDTDIGIVVGAVFDSLSDNSEYSFDTVVHKKYQGIKLGIKLIEFAMHNYLYEIKDIYPSSKLRLDVINPGLAVYLKYKYNLKVINKFGNHVILGD